MAVAIDTNLRHPARELVSADACDGLIKGEGKVKCNQYYKGNKSQSQKDALAAQYLERFGEPMPGLATPSPSVHPSSAPSKATSAPSQAPSGLPVTKVYSTGALKNMVDRYIAGTWDGFHYGYYFG
jgi:hypothetical protein